MNDPVFPNIENLINQGATEVKAWLYWAWGSETELPKYGNWWLGLAESARYKVFKGSQPNLEWAQIATAIYENIDRYSPRGCESCMLSSMMLRVKLISMLGTNADDAILNTQTIIDWFLRSLPLSREVALDKTKLSFKQLADQYPDDLIALRGVKNRLAVIKILSDRNEIEIDGELKEWLSMKDKLP